MTQTNPTVTTVESSTTAGYYGMYAVSVTAGLTIAYGTGWYYPPYYYWGPGMMYPYYYPWPATYGAGFVYNPYTGGFAAGRAVYGPYGAAGGAAWYNPATGRYGRSASVQGWYGGRTVASAYNPWTGGYGATSQAHKAAARGDQWARTGHVPTGRGTAFAYQGSGRQGAGFRGANGTVARNGNYTYAGNDGNVYRKDSSGTWSKYNNGSWNAVDTSAAKQQAQQRFDTARQNRQSIDPSTYKGLNSSAAARQRGQVQTQRFQSFGGGGFRGGGRRR